MSRKKKEQGPVEAGPSQLLDSLKMPRYDAGMTTDKRILEAAKRVTRKRAKTVIDHIIKHGRITTEELLHTYGYKHAPRAAMDVKDEGIPVIRIKAKDKDGKEIAAYVFGDPDKVEGHKQGGRKVFSKSFKIKLIESNGAKCEISSEYYDPLYLQIDHRVPYAVAGDKVSDERDPNAFMLLSGPAQRQKSWACEHCPNYQIKNIQTCSTCYWAFPNNYAHVAMKNIKNLSLTFSSTHFDDYKKIEEMASASGSSVQDIIKDIISKHLSGR
ncbi:HNH endonuclease [Stagnimonas aquatica]|uniref:HNH endonuclease n=1 Tax=Stagnimonas aquatica TaxID=2689987 RepID=UPI0011CE3F59|nr:HNH endonuclease [Stagnimonas aquatica]